MPLSNHQYDKIKREYDKIRLHNKHVLDGRFLEVYHKVPEVKRIDDQIAELSIRHAKQALLNERHSLSTYQEEIRTLSKNRASLLIRNGYPADYLEPVFSCNDCKDTGYLGNQPCHCFKQAVVNILYEQSNIRHLLEQDNFSSFSYDLYPDHYEDPSTHLTPRANIRKVVKVCKDFIENFDETYGNLFIYGNTGVGKTFLSHCIAKELLDRCKTVIYLTSFQFFDILEKNKFRKPVESYQFDEWLSYLIDCELLILDDLGTEMVNSFTASSLFYYINERGLRQKPTIISTNLSLDELNAQYSERVFSRITSNYTLLKLIGDDIRLKKAFQPNHNQTDR